MGMKHEWHPHDQSSIKRHGTSQRDLDRVEEQMAEDPALEERKKAKKQWE